MKKLKIFFDSRMSTNNNSSFSPSAGKPAVFVNAVKDHGGVSFENLHIVPDREALYLAHQRAHVDGILDCVRPNGFGNCNEDVAKTLLFTTGSFMSAAEYAFTNNSVTCSPTSGFHHAGHAYSSGFCTFNGLAVSAIYLHRKFGINIGIIDLDRHYGDGTDNIIKMLGASYIKHYTFGAHNISCNSSDSWLAHLERDIDIIAKDVDILFFQAGADPHVDDPLGGILTTEQLKRRDRIVFEIANRYSLPLVWNLAGGYQKPIEKVIQIHINTLEVCLDTLCKNIKE